MQRTNSSNDGTGQPPRPILENCRPVVEGVLRSRIRSDIIHILGFFEEVALAVASKSAEEDRLKRFFGAVIPGGYDGFEGFILAERSADRDHEYYREAQKLVESWTGRKRREANMETNPR